MYIIHSVDKKEFEDEIKMGSYGRKSLEQYGFIHCSDLDTYYLVAPNFKEDPNDRLILLIDTDQADAEIKWEDGGRIDFPHIYGLLDQNAIIGVYDHVWSDDRTWVPNHELKEYAENGFERKI
ncbi:MAG: DUF952 domain-containing protein [Ruminococcaceae bacterium]|nr:DUF952 domain-containing protein [Oscillospiraceae bacterium]